MASATRKEKRRGDNAIGCRAMRMGIWGTMPVTILRTRDGRLDDADRASFEALKARLQDGPKSILLHLHGGLVDQANGEAAAQRLSGSGPTSYNAPSDCEQIYVIWRTGFFETIQTNWKDLFENDRLYRALLKKLIEYIGTKVMVVDGSARSAGSALRLTEAQIERRLNSGGDAPFADLDNAAEPADGSRAATIPVASDQRIEGEFTATLTGSKDFKTAVDDLAAAEDQVGDGRSSGASGGNAEKGARSWERLDRDIREHLKAKAEAEGARGVLTSAALFKSLVKHGASIAVAVIGRLRTGRGHGVYATIVEELMRELYGDLIGATIWGMMKTDAYEHFAQSGLGAELVDLIAAGDHRLTFVGHSAGSIWASGLMLRAAKTNGFPHFTLLLLAPAVRMTEFAAALEAASPLVDRFRIFAMSDALERADVLLGRGTGAIYPSSLLYLVSGLFEETDGEASIDAPLLGMQRFLNRAPDWLNDDKEEAAIEAVRKYAGGIADAAIYSKVTGGPGLSTDAVSHGGFDDDGATLASVRSFL